MRNITLFTSPKYFKPPFDVIQYNAFRSWLLLDPTPEIIICGNDEGVAGVASELGVLHIPDVELSDRGTPFLSSIFKESQLVAKNSVVAYLNSDIILMDNFLEVVDIVTSRLSNFMVVGQRWDLQVDNYIDFSSTWEDKLQQEVKQRGKLHPACGIDYFIFEKDMSIIMPPFMVGRPSWDMWLMSKALRSGFNVVNATEKILAIHQKHDYSHMGGRKAARSGFEARVNSKLSEKKLAGIREANWKFLNGKLIKK